MNKKEKKKSGGGIIAAIIAILIGIVGNLDFGGGAASVMFLVFIIIFVAIFFVALSKAEKPAAKIRRTVERPTAENTQPSVRTTAPEQKYYDSECERANSEHDHNRRLEQLETFLKDGIISRAEYNILKEKYSR